MKNCKTGSLLSFRSVGSESARTSAGSIVIDISLWQDSGIGFSFRGFKELLCSDIRISSEDEAM